MFTPRYRKAEKKPSLLKKATKLTIGAGIAAGVGYGGYKGFKRLQNPSAKPNAKNTSGNTGLSTNKSSQPPIDKRARNSELVKKRKELLGAKAQGFGTNGRTPAEIENLRRMKKRLGKANAAKANKLRSEGKYFKSFWNKNNMIFFSKSQKEKQARARNNLLPYSAAGTALTLGGTALDYKYKKKHGDFRPGGIKGGLKNPTTYMKLAALGTLGTGLYKYKKALKQKKSRLRNKK